MGVNLVKSGSLFETNAQVIVNAVNCVGVMGKGLALEFKERYPENFKAYKIACEMQNLTPGGIFIFHQNNQTDGKSQDGPTWIVNLATKDHWRDPSQIAWVTQGAALLRDWADKNSIQSIACPALGAGLGGIPWPQVKKEIENVFSGTNIDLHLFEPQGPRPAKSPNSRY